MSIKTSEHNQYFSSNDLALVAAISLFYPVDSIDKRNQVKVIFFFKRDEALDQLIESYYKGSLRVLPQSYFNQLRVIKSRIYGE